MRKVMGHGRVMQENRPDVDAFVDEILGACRKHNMAISYNDDGLVVEIPADEEVSFDLLRKAQVIEW